VTVHPAASALADHQPVYVTPSLPAGAPIKCCCTRWTGPLLDFPTHQAAVLAGAGLLAETMESAPAVQSWPKQPAWPVGDVR
jgi:hypothetical protein